MMKQAIKTIFNQFGLEVRRLTENPKHNLLGLRSLGIRTVVDAGANEGQFARFITKALPGRSRLFLRAASRAIREAQKMGRLAPAEERYTIQRGSRIGGRRT